MKKIPSHQGFTLIELLIVIAILAILFSIVIIAVNPARQFAQARNSQRRSDVNVILNAVYQYSIDNDGALPTTVATSSTCGGSTNVICRHNISCSGVDIDVVADNERYVTSIPIDPQASNSQVTSYNIVKSADQRITICAPLAELGVTISVSR